MEKDLVIYENYEMQDDLANNLIDLVNDYYNTDRRYVTRKRSFLFEVILDQVKYYVLMIKSTSNFYLSYIQVDNINDFFYTWENKIKKINPFLRIKKK